MTPTFTINERILLAANGHHTPFWDNFFYLNTTPWIWVPFYAACALMLYYKFGWRKTLVILLGVGAAVGLADFVCSSVIRPYFKVMRPTNLDNPFHVYVQTVFDKRGGWYGFPSCHAANVFALVAAVAWYARIWFKVVLIAWALMICFTRLYIGVHYPADILAGAAVGSLLGVLAYFICRKMERSVPAIRDSRAQLSLPFQPEYVPLGVLLLTLAGNAIYSTSAI